MSSFRHVHLRGFAFAMLLSAAFLASHALADLPPTRGLTEVNHAKVTLRDGYWARRLATHHEVTIPHGLDRLAGHVQNFDKAAGKYDGPLRGHHAFDSDLHKGLEGALHTLQHCKDPDLLKRVETIIDRIIAAQQDDGFLISYYIVKDPEKRWDNLRLEHQLYNAGHFFEMAVEHKRLTDDDKAIDAARKFADHIDGIFGEGKRYDVGGHEEVELALVKLYRATGERRYLDLCRFFLDERGHAHGDSRKPFAPETIPDPLPAFEHLPENERGRARRRFRNSVRNGRMQDHMPLIEQETAIGHAVRAGYIYSAMADIARFSDASAYEKAVSKIWRDVVERKMYITGGLGTAQYHDEGFGDPYLLPNRTYCESCAGIAHVFWQHRMSLLKADSRYADVMELALYNSAISGIAITGDGFFYQNPLESKNGARRSPWIGLACCPTNLMRIIPQVGGFAYAHDGKDIYVNLYLAGEATIERTGRPKVVIEQTTDYPWDGKVEMTVTPEEPSPLTLRLRIPGWAVGKPVPSDLYRTADPPPSFSLKVNGKTVTTGVQKDGYVHVNREWKAGDKVAIDFPMPVRRVYAHEKIEANNGKVALMRGPVVYSLEGVDHQGVDLMKVLLPRDAALSSEHEPDLLGGVTIVKGKATVDGKAIEMKAVPYYAWANRDRGAMVVWMNEK